MACSSDYAVSWQKSKECCDINVLSPSTLAAGLLTSPSIFSSTPAFGSKEMNNN
jgi:hypothetical protein